MENSVVTFTFATVIFLGLGIFLLVRSNIAQKRREEAERLEVKEKYAKLKLLLQAASTLASFLAGITLVVSVGNEPNNPISFSVSPQIAVNTLAPSDDPLSIFLYAVYFENEQSELNETQKKELAQLAKHISLCGEESNKVELLVHGYASSSKFSSEAGKSNSILAQERADAVSKLIKSNADTFRLNVESSSWANSDDLGRSRLINDLAEDFGGKTEMEHINRVALVSLMSAGRCDPTPRGWVKVGLNKK